MTSNLVFLGLVLTGSALALMVFAPGYAFPRRSDPDAGWWITGALVLCVLAGPCIAAAGWHEVDKAVVVEDKAIHLRGDQDWVVFDARANTYTLDRATWETVKIGDTVHCRVHEVPVLRIDIGRCT